MVSGAHDILGSETHRHDSFRKDGYLSFPGFLLGQETEQLRALCRAFVAARRGAEGRLLDPDAPAGSLIWVRCTADERDAVERASHALTRAAALASRLLGVDGARLDVKLRVFCKPPFCPSEVPWHQDEAFYQYYSESRPEGYRSVNCWVALDPATVEGGCLQYVPGSHVKGLLKHSLMPVDQVEALLPTEMDDRDATGQTLYAEQVDARLAVHATLPAGGINVHHCRTLHYSDRNRSARSRRAFVIICQERSGAA